LIDEKTMGGKSHVNVPLNEIIHTLRNGPENISYLGYMRLVKKHGISTNKKCLQVF
jgi:hypothetical protein